MKSALSLIINRHGECTHEKLMHQSLATMMDRSTSCTSHRFNKNFAVGRKSLNEQATKVTPFAQANDETGNVHVALDGVLSNKDELLSFMMLETTNTMSDSALIAGIYLKEGAGGFSRLHGSYAFILTDDLNHKIYIHCSYLASRDLFYYLSSSHVLAASEPVALLTHPAVSKQTNPIWLSGFFSDFSLGNNQTVFKSILKLLPGECIEWHDNKINHFRVEATLGKGKLQFKTDAGYAARYQELLKQATARACSNSNSVGIMLSSGMDSVPVAYFAKKLFNKKKQGLTAYSWSLTDFSEADESKAIQSICEHVGIDYCLSAADDSFPLAPSMQWPLSPNTPLSNPTQLLKNKVYAAAEQGCCKVLLNAASGDLLYPSKHYLLKEALQNGQMGIFFEETMCILQNGGLTGLFKSPAFKQVIKSMINWHSQPKQPSVWLTDEARGQHLVNHEWPPESLMHKQPAHYRSLLGIQSSGDVSAINYFSNQYGVELRDPYLDWDLANFMLSIPAYQSTRQGQSKFIARNAMKGIMLEWARTQKRQGILASFIQHGILVEFKSWIEHYLMKGEKECFRYVRKDWLQNALTKTKPNTSELLVIWQCVSYEMWRDRYLN